MDQNDFLKLLDLERQEFDEELHQINKANKDFNSALVDSNFIKSNLETMKVRNRGEILRNFLNVINESEELLKHHLYNNIIDIIHHQARKLFLLFYMRKRRSCF